MTNKDFTLDIYSNLLSEYQNAGLPQLPFRLGARAVVNLRQPYISGGEEVGCVITEYATYGDLPATADNDTLARITTTDAEGIWVYKAAVGVDDVGMWFPDEIGSRIDDYVRDAGGGAFRVSMPNGVGSDSLASIAARGWAIDPNAPNTIDDATGDLEFDGNGGAAIASILIFAPAMADGLYFVVVEADAVSAAGGVTNAYTALDVFDGVVDNMLSFTRDSQLDRIGFAKNYNTAAGSYFNKSGDFDRIFMLVEKGAISVAGDGRSEAWIAKNGKTDNSTRCSTLRSDLGTNTALAARFYTHKTAGNLAYLREFHVFKLT